MKTAILKNEGGLEIIDTPIPEIEKDEVLIRVLVCGICTSDMGAWKHGLGGPVILGHEVVGIIESVGEGVKGYLPGDRVTGSIMEGYAEYTKTNYHNLMKVPESLDDSDAIVEPLSCLISGIKRSGLNLGDSAVIIGAGFMGLSMLQLVKLAGVTDLTVIDLRSSALDLAKEYGVSNLLSPDIALAQFKNNNIPFVIETAGAASALELSGEIVSQHGTLVIVGYHPCRRDINMALWNSKALTVINSFEYRKAVQLDNMRLALKLIESKQFALSPLLNHSFEFKDLDEAFQIHYNKTDGYIKSYVRISK